MTDAPSGAGTAYPSIALEFTSGFSFFVESFVFQCFFFGGGDHCIVCSANFSSDNPFGIFKILLQSITLTERKNMASLDEKLIFKILPLSLHDSYCTNRLLI